MGDVHIYLGTGTKFSIYKIWVFNGVLILAVLSITILAFSKGSDRREYGEA